MENVDANNLWTALSVDHAYSWYYILSTYFFNVCPFFVFVPRRLYRTTLIVAGVAIVSQVGWHFRRFLNNKRKVIDRKVNLVKNLSDIRDAMKHLDLKDIKSRNLIFLSFDEICAQLKDGTFDKETFITACRIRALEAEKFQAVTEYIMCSTSTAAANDEGESATTNDILNGIPVSVSEAIVMTRQDRTLGFGDFVDMPATTDALIVKALKAAGAIPFLRTNVAQGHPLSVGLGCSNPIFGRTLNPLDTTRSAGGGSCGEACALALNISVIGVAVDVVGGARIPAHFCGLAALRPTPLRVSAYGLFQAQSEVPACVSPMCRSVSGLIAFMKATCGPEKNELDPSLLPPDFDEDLLENRQPLKIGYYTEDKFTKTSPAVNRAIHEAKIILEKQGHKVVPFEPPDMKSMLTNLLYPATMGSNRVLWNFLSQNPVDDSNINFYYYAKIANPFKWIWTWLKQKHLQENGLGVAALPITLKDWWHLRNEIQEFRQSYHALWKQAKLDAVVGPVFPCAAVNLTNEGRFLACLTHVGLFSLVNYPAGTVPLAKVNKTDLSMFNTTKFKPVSPLEELMKEDQLGDQASQEKSSLGLPVGVQVAALPFHDETVLRVMKELEDGRDKAPFTEEGRRSSLLQLKAAKPYSNHISDSELTTETFSFWQQNTQADTNQHEPSEEQSEVIQDVQPTSSYYREMVKVLNESLSSLQQKSSAHISYNSRTESSSTDVEMIKESYAEPLQHDARGNRHSRQLGLGWSSRKAWGALNAPENGS